MIKCQATIEPDYMDGIFYVEVVSDCGKAEQYMIPFVEAEDQARYPNPEDYAAMRGIELFLAKHEKEPADGVNTRS
jgi:hypothetical protein